MPIHCRMLLLTLLHASLILMHALPIIIHWLGFRLHVLIHALPNLIHWVGFRVSTPYLETCTTYLNTLSQVPILIHALPIFIHALPILTHCQGFRFHNLIHELPILILWVDFWSRVPNLKTCTTYLKTLSCVPILIHALRIFKHALPILIHWLVSISQYIGPTRIASAELSTLGNQSESSITSPESSANQYRALRHPSRVLLHPRALG